MIVKKIVQLLFVLFLFVSSSCAQEKPILLPEVEDEAFANRLESLLDFTVPVIGVKELAEKKEQYLILDIREKEEYKVSHIPGALSAGYKDFNWELLEKVQKDQAIVLYCSVGYRSEKMGEKIKAKGFSDVQNLYGSIFEWANEDFPLVDNDGATTKKIHTYNSRWSKWVEDGDLIKVW